MMDVQRHNGTLVRILSASLDRGGHSLADAPGLLKQLLEGEGWREFVDQTGKTWKPARFIDFVTTPPLGGLGTTEALVKRICQDDATTANALDKALQNPHGGDRSKSNNIHLGHPEGTSRAAALRRLRKDRPDLLAEVEAGNLKAHAAMVQAGFRHRTISIPVDNPERVAVALRRHLNEDDLRMVTKLLSGDPP